MKKIKNIDDRTIGNRILLNAIKMEELLIEILRLEVKIIKKRNKDECNSEDIKNTNKIIKYILFSITLMDDRIKTGLELIKSHKEE